jgi:hypothetical protein
MKHVSQILEGKNATDMDASNDQTEYEPEPLAEVDSIIEDIQMRANYVGPVLEGILHTGHERVSWGS